MPLLHVSVFSYRYGNLNFFVQELQDVIKYEQQHGGIVLDPSMLNPASSKSFGIGSNSNSSSNFRPPAANQVCHLAAPIKGHVCQTEYQLIFREEREVTIFLCKILKQCHRRI